MRRCGLPARNAGPHATHRALQQRAAKNNSSTAAEIRAILDAAARPEGRLRLGTALAAMSRAIGLTNADVEALEQARAAGLNDRGFTSARPGDAGAWPGSPRRR